METEKSAETKRVKWIGPLPDECDFCRDERLRGGFVDGKTKEGPWATMCRPCHKEHGVGLGPGLGQLYDERGYKLEG